MRELRIIGGGIAGLTLGIVLRRAGVPVELWEAHRYPRHRVCGEFISGRGAELLGDLVPELRTRLREASTVQFFSSGRQTAPLRLPSSAVSLSRWELDNSLADSFARAGGYLRTGERWREAFTQAGVIRASGRHAANKARGWTGLKAHLRSFASSADLEMHFGRDGYVGISKLATGTNICALVRDDFPIAQFRQQPLEVFQRLLDRREAGRLAAAELLPDSCCAVAGISAKARRTFDEFCIGDAIRMIPPFTGNGMSLAIESAFIAAPILIQFSQGQLQWADALKIHATLCEQKLRARFAAATLLGALTKCGWTRSLMLSSLRTVPQVLSICFGATR